MASNDGEPKAPPWWLRIARGQFSLRTLLMIVVLGSLAIAFWASFMRPYLRDQEVIDYLTDRRVAYTTIVRGPEWVRYIVGDAYFRRIESIEMTRPTKKDVRVIGQAKDLRRLTLWKATQFDDSSVLLLEGMRDLEELMVGSRGVGSAGLRRLCRNHPDLRVLWLGGDKFAGEGLEPLGQLEKLEVLVLSGIVLKDAGLRHLAGLANLSELRLRRMTLRGDRVRSYLAEIAERHGSPSRAQ